MPEGPPAASLLRRSEVSVEHIFIQIVWERWHMVQHFGWKGIMRLGWPPGSICELPQSGPPAPTSPRVSLSTPNRPDASFELFFWTVPPAHHKCDWPPRVKASNRVTNFSCDTSVWWAVQQQPWQHQEDLPHTCDLDILNTRRNLLQNHLHCVAEGAVQKNAALTSSLKLSKERSVPRPHHPCSRLRAGALGIAVSAGSSTTDPATLSVSEP